MQDDNRTSMPWYQIISTNFYSLNIAANLPDV